VAESRSDGEGKEGVDGVEEDDDGSMTEVEEMVKVKAMMEGDRGGGSKMLTQRGFEVENEVRKQEFRKMVAAQQACKCWLWKHTEKGGGRWAAVA